MMKKITYETPEMEVVLFEAEDIITLSIGPDSGEGEHWGSIND